jgi:translation initiation factor 2 subunit 2
MKKKKKSKKKVDLDAFEKELNESKAKSKTEDTYDEDDEGPPPDGSHLDNIDEEELGDDPFARPDVGVGVDAGNEAWLNSDRDYTYEEVRPIFVSTRTST